MEITTKDYAMNVSDPATITRISISRCWILVPHYLVSLLRQQREKRKERLIPIKLERWTKERKLSRDHFPKHLFIHIWEFIIKYILGKNYRLKDFSPFLSWKCSGGSTFKAQKGQIHNHSAIITPKFVSNLFLFS